MEETEDKSDDNLILSDLVNDWILEPIIDSVDRQNIVFTLTTKGKEYFKILNKDPGYPFKNNPTLQIMKKTRNSYSNYKKKKVRLVTT